MTNTVRVLQDENQYLKRQIGALKDELKQKDMIIAALESQVAALVLANRKDQEGVYEDDSETDADTLSRVSSLGLGSLSNYQGNRSGAVARNALPPRPPKAAINTVSNHSISNKNNRRFQEDDSSDDDSNSPSPPKPKMNSRLPPAYPPTLRPPNRNANESAPKNGNKRNTNSKESIDSGGAYAQDDDAAMANSRGKFQSDKAAIKALPRELSIYNNDDDDVTKYSIDDGQPTYLVEKSEFRDAYNVRGIYTGTIHRSSGMPHGFGKMVYHLGGRYYEGDWHMGHWHGKGIFRNQEGDVYEGHMVNDLKEGTGKLTYADGRIFQGKFDDDEAVEGTIKFPDGAFYRGALYNGARHGYGVYHFNDGSVYEGESVMNVFEGKGKMTWNDGGWYEGDWHQGEIHGKGKEIRPDGSLRHDGQWIKGVPIRD
ncbi:MORN repeat-containing protein [Nitzschia inconspicua]|uniref:MORN repeat-containing protein n=1 Tax=Nitzschia inconspicua TaxID=303405 RepID=A0A9K3L8Y6_9STRA|nr:MORN repeat-containing protein [Nitzschia inconspicua]